MHICHFAKPFLPQIGGAELVVHNLAVQQRKTNEVTVIAPWRSWRAMNSKVPYRIVPLLPALARNALSPTSLRVRILGQQLAMYHRLLNFDLLHVHNAYVSGVAVAPFLRKTRIPSVLTCHGADIQTLPEIGYGHRLDPQVDQSVRRALCVYDRVIAISASMRTELEKAGVPGDKIRDVPNGAEVHKIRELEVDRYAVRRALGIPDDKIFLLTVGRNHPKKGYQFIPSIIKEIVQERSNFIWMIVGKGAEPIAAKAEQLGVSEFLRIVPQIGAESFDQSEYSLPTNGLIRIFRAADIFIFPTLLESFGIVSVEAMAAGLPIIATDAPGSRDIVVHEGTGLLSPTGDVSAMASNVLQLLDSPRLIKQYAHAAQSAAEQYDWEIVSSQYFAVYEELCHISPQVA